MNEPSGVRFALLGEVLAGGFKQLWTHRLRSLLTLTLLMLGAFALVVMSSMLGGIREKVSMGFKGMSWDGTLVLQPRLARGAGEQKRFAQSPGLRMDDLALLTAPAGRVMAFLPRASTWLPVRMAGGSEQVFVCGSVPDYFPVMNRRISSGRGLTEADRKRRSAVAVLGASLAAKFLGGADPVGKEILVHGSPFRVVGVLAPLMIYDQGTYMDANGILVPLEAFMDRLQPARRLDSVTVKLRATRDLPEVTALLLSRARQAHHGIEDLEVKNLDAEAARSYQGFLKQMRNLKFVLFSLAGTVLLVGGVGVLSVMLIASSERRFEIGLRKALGASDRLILLQFMLEAGVLGALGALAGTLAGALVCQALSPRFPYGLVVNPAGLALAWATALALALGFGLYPALRAMRLSPMEAMR